MIENTEMSQEKELKNNDSLATLIEAEDYRDRVELVLEGPTPESVIDFPARQLAYSYRFKYNCPQAGLEALDSYYPVDTSNKKDPEIIKSTVNPLNLRFRQRYKLNKTII